MVDSFKAVHTKHKVTIPLGCIIITKHAKGFAERETGYC